MSLAEAEARLLSMVLRRWVTLASMDSKAVS